MAKRPPIPAKGAPIEPQGPTGEEASSPPTAEQLANDVMEALRPLVREATRTAARDGWKHRAVTTIAEAVAGTLKTLNREGATRPTEPAMNLFRRAGSSWDVVFEARRFTIPDSLGAKYLDPLLHRPNVPVRAWELEQLVNSSKTPRGVNGG